MKDIPTNKQFTGRNKMDILNKTILLSGKRGAVVKLLLNYFYSVHNLFCFDSIFLIYSSPFRVAYVAGL